MSRGPHREFSAGGVVLRDGHVAVIVPTRRGPEGQRVLALPKGHPDPGESAEEAAAREVREETGLDGRLVGPLGEVSYRYHRDGRMRVKSVSFFQFDYVAGTLDDHDGEVEEARWMPVAEAVQALSFAGEREMVRRAMSQAEAER